METNRLPAYDAMDNPTGCCPRFRPENWDGQDLHFRDKPFVRVTTRSVMHAPMNMGSVFTRTQKNIEKAGACDAGQFAVLSHEISPWAAEHFFSVSRKVPEEQMVSLSGNYRAKVFEGPYKDAPKWAKELKADLSAAGKEIEDIYFFYTTCPSCSRAYGKNYVVGLAKLATVQTGNAA